MGNIKIVNIVFDFIKINIQGRGWIQLPISNNSPRMKVHVPNG